MATEAAAKPALRGRSSLPAVVVALATLAFAIGCTRFVWQGSLASFADDSVSYLVMAQVFSPYFPASEAIAGAFLREAYYPPLFPLLLAVSGTSHDMALAHAVSAFLLAVSLPLLYRLASRWLESRWGAAGLVVALACLPALWIEAKGILSEPLFLLLAIALLLAAESSARRKPLLLALLFAALALTRTVGIVLAAGYALWAISRPGAPWRGRVLATAPSLAGPLAYGMWVMVRPAATADDYVRILRDHAGSYADAGDVLAVLGARLATQLQAMGDAWAGAFVIYLVEGRPVPLILAGIVGAAALAGMLLRLVQGKPDPWMVAAYLSTFLLWPFPGQMTRFLLPLLPVLLLYAHLAAAAAARGLRRRPAVPLAAMTLGVLSLALPAMAFLHQRAQLGAREGFAAMTEWYRAPDLAVARARADVHLGLLADMQRIHELTGPRDVVMWVAPSYIPLLADRHAIAAPSSALAADQYREAIHRARPRFVFLSAYHPRETLSDAAWRTGTRSLADEAQVVYARASRVTGKSAALLLRVPAAPGRAGALPCASLDATGARGCL